MQSISSNFVGIPGGILMSLIAFSIVFLVTAGLMLMMIMLKHIAAAIEGKQQSASPAASSAGTPPSTAAKAVAVPLAAAAAADDELVAVITASVMALCGPSARVISFSPAKRPVSAGIWRSAGRFDNMEGLVG